MEETIKKIKDLATEIALFSKENNIGMSWNYIDDNNIINVYNADDYETQAVKFFGVEVSLYSKIIQFYYDETEFTLSRKYDNAKHAFESHLKKLIMDSTLSRILEPENELNNIKNSLI